MEGTARPLRPEAMQTLIMLAMVSENFKRHPNPEREKKITDELEENLTGVSLIIRKRMEVLELPIQFDIFALTAVVIFADGNPGRAMMVLIDALNKYEGQTVSIEDLCQLYPDGIYDEESFGKKLAKIRAREEKWSEIY